MGHHCREKIEPGTKSNEIWNNKNKEKNHRCKLQVHLKNSNELICRAKNFPGTQVDSKRNVFNLKQLTSGSSELGWNVLNNWSAGDWEKRGKKKGKRKKGRGAPVQAGSAGAARASHLRPRPQAVSPQSLWCWGQAVGTVPCWGTWGDPPHPSVTHTFLWCLLPAAKSNKASVFCMACDLYRFPFCFAGYFTKCLK